MGGKVGMGMYGYVGGVVYTHSEALVGSFWTCLKRASRPRLVCGRAPVKIAYTFDSSMSNFWIPFA